MAWTGLDMGWRFRAHFSGVPAPYVAPPRLLKRSDLGRPATTPRHSEHEEAAIYP